jgi:hypothetical protein
MSRPSGGVHAFLTCTHESASKRVLDALDAAEETGARLSCSTSSSMPHDRFTSFSDFYPFYLSEHRSAACRRLHFAGTMSVIVLSLAAALMTRWWLLALVPIAGLWLCLGRTFHFRTQQARHLCPSLVQPVRGFRHVPRHADRQDQVLTI